MSDKASHGLVAAAAACELDALVARELGSATQPPKALCLLWSKPGIPLQSCQGVHDNALQKQVTHHHVLLLLSVQKPPLARDRVGETMGIMIPCRRSSAAAVIAAAASSL